MKNKPLHFSYEFFPPRSSEMSRRLWRSVGQLERLNPSFFSMTYGALGSARDISIDSAITMREETPVPVAAHLTCAGTTRAEIDAIATRLRDAGFNRLVALRGDSDGGPEPGEQYRDAAEFVEGLLKIHDFDISVAAYPEVHPKAKSAEDDLVHLKRKLDAGATRAITQYFFDADRFLRFRDAAAAIGIEKPIVPGILPVHDYDKLCAFSQRCGAPVPTMFAGMFEQVRHDPAGRHQLAVQLAVELCERLAAEGVDHLHLYTLNLTDICLDISLALGASHKPLKASSAA